MREVNETDENFGILYIIIDDLWWFKVSPIAITL